MQTLNESQRRAVTAPDGPVLVLAGAGSGKTRVIVERLVWLIEERGLEPRHVLALTFTNRAADEMRTRVMARLGVERLASWVGTFHSFALYVLRREIERLGLSPSFTIFDGTDQLAVVKRVLRDLPPAFMRIPPREALQWISRLKQDLAEPAPDAAAASEEARTRQAVWDQYHAALRKSSALDFDDLLVCLVRVLREHPEAREKYQRRYRHILIDEYQDTNHAQYEIARLLAEKHRNLFVVGDEDQSIYAWRGAAIHNILSFEEEYPGATVVRLEQNYRSTAAILSAANAVVSRNEARLGKTLWTAQKGGDPVRFYLAEDAEDEARFVADRLAAEGGQGGSAAVLYRTNAQSRVLEEVFRKKGVPYVVVGSVGFYHHKEIKDVLAYLRLLLNPADDEAVRRILNVPARGLGAVSLQRFEEYAAARGEPLFQVLRDVEHDQSLAVRARDAVSHFVHLIDDLAQDARRTPVFAIVEAVLERTRYREYLRMTDEKDFRTRLENVDEFQSACRVFDRKGAGGLETFLQELSLLSDADGYDPSAPAVKLMTCHSAKGLEFDSVFLVGLEEGLLPHAVAFDSKRDIEEERRLCYVAMTRARRRLTLTAAQGRMLHGDTQRRNVSRFVREIPPNLLDVAPGSADGATAARPGAAPPRAGAAAAKSGPVKLGTRVFHAKFGRGYVLYTTGSGAGLRARIRFETGRVATFMVSKAPLEILEGKKP